MRNRRLGAVIMMLATGSCMGAVTQSTRRKTVEAKPYTDICQAQNDQSCVDLCIAAFELGDDKKVTACSYKIEGDTTLITMSWEKKSEDEMRQERGQGCAGGRRPFGWEPAGSAGSPGGYLAWCAQMEAASVTAFARIYRQLETMGAPAALLALVRDAIADELDHARVMAGLARRYGATPVLPEIGPAPEMTDLDCAIDNAVAGCVGETVSALHAAFLGAHASDPVVRAAFAQIAQDETRHAYLAFELAAFYEARLTTEQKHLVAKARDIAVANTLAEPLHPGMIALGVSAASVIAASRELLADPAAG